MGRKEEAHDSKTAYGGADHRRVEGCPGWGQCSEPVPEARHLGCHLLYVAVEIRRPGRQRCEELRQLEDENRRLKQMVAEQALDIQALKAITEKNWYGPRRNGQPLR